MNCPAWLLIVAAIWGLGIVLMLLGLANAASDDDNDEDL